MASIEEGGVTGQAPTVAQAGAVLPPAMADGGPAEAEMKTIFISYSHATKAEVAQFREELRIRLLTRGRSYRVFRDDSRDAGENIPVGYNYREVISKALVGSVCCLVVLVPSIFESNECELECVKFKELLDGGKPGFFFPVEFLPVGAEFAAASPPKSRIISILQRIKRADFTAAWNLPPTDQAYRRAVDEIAAAIDRHVRNPPPWPPPPDLMPGKRGWPTAAAIAAAVAAVALVLSVFAGVPSRVAGWLWPAPVWLPAGVSLELVEPVPAYAEDRTTQAPDVGPGIVAVGDARGTVAIDAATIGGVAWYRVTEADGSEEFVRSDDVPPPWQQALDDAGRPVAALDIVVQTPSYPTPDTMGATQHLSVGSQIKVGNDHVIGIMREAPDSGDWYRIDYADRPWRFIPVASVPAWIPVPPGTELVGDIVGLSQPDTANGMPRTARADGTATNPRLATLAGLAWYRVSTPGGDVFFPKAGNEDRLAVWSAVEGCLIAIRDGGLAAAPMAEPGFAGVANRQPVGLGEGLQSAEIGGTTWYRFTQGTQTSYASTALVELHDPCPVSAP